MPDLEELIRRTLRERQAEAPVGADLLVGARTRRRKRRTGLAVIGVAVATAAAVITPLAVISHGRSIASEQLPSGQGTSPPPSIVGGVDDPMFTAAAPMLGLMIIGPVPMQQPTCTPSEIHATAELRRSTYGVVGVVEMHGDHCSIPMYPGPSAFVDADGQPLDIPVVAGKDVGANIRPDLAFAAGDAAWGFAWTGSWCGATPAGLVIPLTGSPRVTPLPTVEPSLTVPLTGPTLDCTGASDSTLVPGAPGRIGEPVLPPPPAWSSLRATLVRTDPTPTLERLQVTLTNDSDNEVILDPCPQFRVVADYEYADGSAQGTDGGLFPCDSASSVPAHGKITVNLPPLDLDSQDSRVQTQVTVTFGVAGGVTASIDLPVK